MKLNKLALQRLIDKSKQIAILSPDDPDMDSVSSNLALAETFKSMGKRVKLWAAAPMPYDLEWLLGKWRYQLAKEMPAAYHPDLAVITDSGSMGQLSQLTKDRQWLVNETATLVVDHHAVRDDFKHTLAVIDASAAATGELLYDLYKAMGWAITPRIARLMLTGIISDTGGFRNLNTTSRLLRTAANLIDLEADLYGLRTEAQQAVAFTPAKFRTLIELAKDIRFDGPIVYGLIPYRKIAKYGPNAGFTHALGDQIRYLKGIEVSFILVEREDKSLRLSMRSEPTFNVSKIAAVFGGGGHKVAAGAAIKGMDLETAAKEVLKRVKLSRR